MRLSSFTPAIPEAVVSSLENFCDVRTDGDLFSVSAFDIFRHLPAGTLTLRQLKDYKKLIVESISASAILGSDLLLSETQARQTGGAWTTGLEPLDDLFNCLNHSRVIEVSGERGSGKSTLILNVALRHLAASGDSNIAWIDTTGKFSAERANKILASIPQASVSALKRLRVTLAFGIESVYDVLEDLDILTSAQPGRFKLQGIIIDNVVSITELYSSGSSHGHTMMAELLLILRNFALRCSVSIIVINSAFASVSTSHVLNTTPALGPIFSFLTDATLCLNVTSRSVKDCIICKSPEECQNSSTHHAAVLRSRSMKPSALYCTFTICHGIISGLSSP